VAAAVGRSVAAVRHRARHLGLQSSRTWSAEEEELLRRSWGSVPARRLAGRLGRPYGAVKQKAAKLGLDGGRRYTDEEKQLLRELYPTHTAAQIAERLHGSPRAAKAVYRLACSLGLAKCPHHQPETVDKVRAALADGLTDADAGRRLGMTRWQVTHIRRTRLKLPKNAEAILAAQRRGVESQARALGVTVGGGLRKLAYRVYAAQNGWPDDLRPREVQVLNALAARGVPMTRLELAQAIGMRTDRVGANGTLALLSGNGPGGTYTASLLRRGLLAVIKRASHVAGQGRGKSRSLYHLGPTALTILEERAACQQNTPATH
jgi:hypothetical protein